MEMHIRDARPGDENEIIDLIQILAQRSGETSPVYPAYVTRFLVQPDRGVLLAECDGQMLGLLSYSIHPNLYHAGYSGLIEELVVREGSRGQGVGSALVKTFMARAEAAECVEVSVSTLLDNHPAIDFYRERGFTDEALFLEKHF